MWILEAAIYSKILRLHSSDLDCQMKYVHGPVTINLSDIPENNLETLYNMKCGDWPVFCRYHSRYFISLLSLNLWLDLQEIVLISKPDRQGGWSLDYHNITSGNWNRGREVQSIGHSKSIIFVDIFKYSF